MFNPFKRKPQTSDFARDDLGLRYLPYDKLRSYQRSAVDNPNVLSRISAASMCYGLDKLVHDEEPAVRMQVAALGFGLDVLEADPDPQVRKRVQMTRARLSKEHPKSE